MPLIFERDRGHDMGRMVCQFSMLDGIEPIRCLASWELMDDLQRVSDVTPYQREAQFEALRVTLADMASRKYFAFNEPYRPKGILITTKDLII